MSDNPQEAVQEDTPTSRLAQLPACVQAYVQDVHDRMHQLSVDFVHTAQVKFLRAPEALAAATKMPIIPYLTRQRNSEMTKHLVRMLILSHHAHTPCPLESS